MSSDSVNKTPETGCLFVISAPSGAGKTTLCRAVLDRFPDIYYSISHTTRTPRGSEQNGVEYFFVSEEGFKQGIEKDQWLEWAVVHGNYYGTSAEITRQMLQEGRDVLLDIDVQGAAQIQKKHPGCITIFIMPPSMDILRERLEKRETDSPEAVRLRLANAEKEIACKDRYRHIIVNDRLEKAAEELMATFERYRSPKSETQ